MALRGIMYTIDSAVAIVIIAGAIIALTSMQASSISSSSDAHVVEDLTIALSTITVSESTNPYIAQLRSTENISSAQEERTLLEYLSELWAFNETDTAQALYENLTAGLGPRFPTQLLINNEAIAGTGLGERTLTRSARLVSGINKSAPVRGYSANLFLTGANTRTTNHYHYFDGLTGMGTITMNVYIPENAEIFNVSMEAVPGADFTVTINGNTCGSYTAGDPALNVAQAYTIENTASCNFSEIFEGSNTVTIEFPSADFTDQYIAGGFLRIRYLSDQENTALLTNVGGGLVRERIYLNGVDALANIFSGFTFPGEIINITAHLHFDNQAEINELYMRIADRTVFVTNTTGEQTHTINNATLTSYVPLDVLSDRTIPLRFGHFDSTRYDDDNAEADAMVTIQSATSMETCDFPYDGSFNSGCDATNTYIERLTASKNATKEFAQYFLNTTGNRMGLVKYHATVPPGQVVGLTSSLSTILTQTDNTLGQTPPLCFTCAIARSASELRTNSDPSRKRAILLMSDGYTNRCFHGNPNCNPLGGMTQEEKALEEAIEEACDIWDRDQITIYTVAYGLGADEDGLREMSEGCTDGIHFSANNLTSLIDIYRNISFEIQGLSYLEQIPILEGNITSILYADSYIEATYYPNYAPSFGDLTISGETEPFTNSGTRGELALSDTNQLLEASVLSYSGPRWTNLTRINNLVFYNVSTYGANITEIGDPFRIRIPNELFENTTNIITLNLTNTSTGSDSNRITYRIVFQNTANSFSTVLERGEGCTWTVLQENLENLTIKIPSDYTGSKECSYTDETYDTQDAYDVSAMRLFRQLDIDNTGMINILLDEQNLAVESTIIEDVPSLWGPATFEVRIAR